MRKYVATDEFGNRYYQASQSSATTNQASPQSQSTSRSQFNKSQSTSRSQFNKSQATPKSQATKGAKGKGVLQRNNGRPVRSVVYGKTAQIPPAWHCWLHHSTDELPTTTSPPTTTSQAIPERWHREQSLYNNSRPQRPYKRWQPAG